MKTIKERTYPGTTSTQARAYEAPHRELARKAACEGIVLLKNEGHFLPVPSDSRIALYGSGAIKTVKGGTGSGDVNEREYVNIYSGLLNAGFTVTTADWLEDYQQQYDQTRLAWKDKILSKCGTTGSDFFEVYSTTPYYRPTGRMAEKTDAETAVFVLSRVAGEGADRNNSGGDYTLSDEEEALLARICELYANVIVLINAGSVVDCSFIDKYQAIRSVLFISQPGMEAGNAVADVLTGKATPCGKLTDTWALEYSDYPNAEIFSHNNGNVEKEYYEEGIYVGYRYFDTFDIPVRFGFGFGLSYTDFSTEVVDITKENGTVSVAVQVKNTGNTFSGKEVVQVYVSCPDGKLEKEYRRLVGFAKTGLLAPGENETVHISFGIGQLTSFEEETARYILEPGVYGIFAGSSLSGSVLAGSLVLNKEIVAEQLKNICPVTEKLTELSYKEAANETVTSRRKAMEAEVHRLPCFAISAEDIEYSVIDYDRRDKITDAPEMDFVRKLSQEQLILLATGNPVRRQGSNIGSSGISVPGSAAETSDCAMSAGLANIVLADGPAGLRLNKTYQVHEGRIIPAPFKKSFENGFFADANDEVIGETYYQYCTAIPVGTLLAQTWDTELIRKIGAAIAEEMCIFDVTLWLAPGMNIHRNPLCGRNFEYYSEDPFVSGAIAAAMTNGVQSVPGCGTTIKHLCCNNQEDNRTGSDSILSERALREIYLKGFEIAVKTSQPMAIMTSYNLVNGIHTANSYDICTSAVRKEWNFGGTIMTDWNTTRDCTAAGCMLAGNDLVMPGQLYDHDSIRQALADGSLTMEQLQLCIAHTVHVIMQSNQYSDVSRYQA